MWNEDQKWEAEWWGNCTNTYGEEEKQLVYARKMGLKFYHDGKSPYNIDNKGKILDIGGGPCSLLLKTPLAVKRVVVDPCEYPKWVVKRYKDAGITLHPTRGEDLDFTGYDEVWIYNCLQHTESPKKIIENARKAGKIIRIFEWIDTGTSKGHPNNLTEEKLNKWLEGEGKVEVLNYPTLKGKSYYGIFKGKI